jgi:hypothetical protein
VPVEDPDRIDRSAVEHRRLRRRADDALREIVVEDTWGFVPSSLEVSGTPDERVARVLAWISDAKPPVPTKRAARR